MVLIFICVLCLLSANSSGIGGHMVLGEYVLPTVLISSFNLSNTVIIIAGRYIGVRCVTSGLICCCCPW